MGSLLFQVHHITDLETFKMATLFDTTRNFSFYTIPAAWLIAFLPHPYAVSLSKKFDNVSPRTYVGSLQHDQTIDQATALSEPREHKPTDLRTLVFLLLQL